MESFLNILWFLMAVAGFCVWQMCLVRQKRQAPRDPVKEWTAVVCMLVFLFFAVSLTDDLHSDLVVLDECSAGRRTWVHAHGAAPPAKIADGASAAMLAPALSMELPMASEPGPLATPLEPVERSLRITSGRSPPERSL